MDYIKKNQFENIFVAENREYKWGVVDAQDNIIVPFGKYGWIDSFEQGLARVRTDKRTTYTKNTLAMFLDDDLTRYTTDPKEIEDHMLAEKKAHPERFAKWGIINTQGEEVLPLEYDNIWNFVGKNRCSTRVEKDGESHEVYFSDLKPQLHETEDVDDYYDDEPDSYDDGYDGSYFRIQDCYDIYGNFDYERLEDAILDGEYVPDYY